MKPSNIPLRGELPALQPGEEHAYEIAAQKFVLLRRILIPPIGLTLVRLWIGVVEVPFELESADGTYRMTGLGDETLKKRLIGAGAAVASFDTVALAPALEVHVLLRNDGAVPEKPRVSLLVQEEVT